MIDRRTMILLLLPLAGAGCLRLGPAATDPATWRAQWQPALADGTAHALATSPTLALAVTLAAERNAAAESARRRWLAAIYTMPQATAPPDPMLEATWNIDEVMTLMGVQEGSVGLSQEFPWWQKLWARGRSAATEAAIAQVRWEEAVRDAAIDAKDACYELYYLDRAIGITAAAERVLATQGALAYQELARGRGPLNEGLRAESQAAQLAYDRQLLAERRVVEEERLRGLLNLPPGTPIGRIDAAPAYDIESDLAPLLARAERHAQMLRARGLEVERENYQHLLARLERIPDVRLGVDRMILSRSEESMEPDNGDNMWAVGGGLNLPIWEQRNRAMIAERKAMKEAMELEGLGDANTLRAAVAAAWYRVRLTARLGELYRDTLLPQAEIVMRQGEADWRAGAAGLSIALEGTLAWHNFQLAYHRAIADHGRAIGELERALGTTAEPRPAEVVQ